MAGHGPNHGKLRGQRPNTGKLAPPFKKGDPRSIAIQRKGVQAAKEKCARFKSLREAAMALRDVPAFNSKGFPEMSNGVAAVVAMYHAAQEGDPKAFHELSNLMGELIEKVQVSEVPKIVDDVPRVPDPGRAKD